MLAQLPPHVLAALYAYRTCELTTIGRDGTPITVPVSGLILPDENRLIITTSIGLPNKAFNIRRDSRVALLFSEPTGSGLERPPVVLIQGEAVCPDKVETWTPELARFWQMMGARQPASSAMITNPLGRWLMDWYYMRLLISVTPRRVRWWEQGALDAMPEELEVSYVV